MDWYYAESKKPFGPIDEKEFLNLIEKGTIMPHTLVWRSGMKEWKPLSDINLAEVPTEIEEKADVIETSKDTVPEDIDTEYEAVEDLMDCSHCGGEFDKKEMIFYLDQWICPSCKAGMTDKMADTPLAETRLQYADFWLRACAKIIDLIILTATSMVLSLFLAFFVSQDYDSEVSMSFHILVNFFQLIIAVSYTTYFLGKYSATPGKMACHIKVVTPDGGKVSYSQAFFRYFAEIISSLIFCIGYLMAIFDTEKRTLHDRIAGTRVVKNQ